MFMTSSCGAYYGVENYSGEEERSGEEKHVVILGTSDMHGNVWGYSYEDGTESDNNGMSRLYTYIEKVREENPIVYLVDAGDNIQGTIMTDDIANERPKDPHPVMAAMNFMGYDSMTLGNHEFNWGIDTMKKIISQAEFPVLAANVLDKEGNYVSGEGWTIIEKGGVKLAIIGVCTPDIPIWDGLKEGIEDTTFEDPDVAVKKAIEEIGDKADIIMVSAHMGMNAEFDFEGGSDSGKKIVEENPEVDLLQLAHDHVTINDKINDVPTVAVRNSGREIARIDLTLDKNNEITDIKTEIVDMADQEPSEEIRSIDVVKAVHEEAINYIGINSDGEVVGIEGAKKIGTTTAKFQPEDEIKGIPEGRLQDTAVLDLIMKIQLLNSGADVTSCALFKNDSDLPEGTIYYGNIFDIYKYDNILVRFDITGKGLKDYMEWSASGYNQWQSGDINISFDPERPEYLMDMFAGVEYEINLSKPVGERIENLTFKGKPLEDDQVLKLAVNNYRFTSAILKEKFSESNPDWTSSESIRDMIVSYFEENSPIEPSVDNNWKITGVDLQKDDTRRAEIIGYINERLLPAPYDKSYNLADYDMLVAEALKNLEEGITVEEVVSH
ncbi:MAG: 5'-nucleotidase C-terminal domain-containing protein [Lachnospiraceae bacterium]|nr:5'-nucleotidase C-terminal domain-containing protein [Lachnospiraceae bacterium]